MKLNNEEKPKREGFFALTRRLNGVIKEQKKAPDADEKDKIKLEWKDYVAMFVSAFLTLFLPAVLVLGVISVAVMAIFGMFG